MAFRKRDKGKRRGKKKKNEAMLARYRGLGKAITGFLLRGKGGKKGNCHSSSPSTVIVHGTGGHRQEY